MHEQAKLNQAWGAIRVTVRNVFSFYEIKEIAGLAGLDVTRLASLVQKAEGGSSKGELLTALDGEVDKLDDEQKIVFLTYFAERVVSQHPDHADGLSNDLQRLGWQFGSGKLVPIELPDLSELTELPDAVRDDLIKAATRLRDGDLGGALTAACAAVDSAANAVIPEEKRGHKSKAGFQSRVVMALKEKETFNHISEELVSLGWEKSEAAKLAQNLRGALNHGAFVMQSLRAKMSDAHGSKRVLGPLVFDSIKWAALIVRMLK